MLIKHIHHALEQVQALQELVDRQRFQGYSGRARMACGVLAVVATIFLAGNQTRTPEFHLLVWGGVFMLAFLMDYGAILYWFLNDPQVNRKWRRLRPALDVVPTLLIAGVLTLALIMRQQYNSLFGIWMCLFGLANFNSRKVLPRSIAYVGIFYMIAGTVYLLTPGTQVVNPWPMGLVYGVGELAGGLILHFDQTRKLSKL